MRTVPNGGHLEDTDVTPGEAVRREIAEETGVTALQPYGDDTPRHIDVHTVEARPDNNESVHVHYDVRNLCQARGSVAIR